MVDKKRIKTLCGEGSHHCSYFSKTNFDTVNRREKSQASNKTVDTPILNKTEKVKSIYKSRYTQRTDSENTVNK